MASRLALLLWLVVTVSTTSATDGSSSSDWQDALVITEYPVENATSATENANVTKYFTVSPPESNPNAVPKKLDISVIGRVFVNYVDYHDAGDLVNSSTLVLVKVSSDSVELIDLVYLDSYRWLESDGPELLFSFNTYKAPPPRSHALFEISIFRKSMVHSLIIFAPYSVRLSSLEAVVGDGVLYSSTERPEFTTDSDGYLLPVEPPFGEDWPQSETNVLVAEAATLYLLTQSTPLYVSRLTLESQDGANLYVDASTFVAGVEVMIATTNSVAVVFVGTIETDHITLDAYGYGKICLFVNDSFKTGADTDIYPLLIPENIALPDQSAGIEATGEFTCVKAKIPEHTPRLTSPYTPGFTRADSKYWTNASDVGDPDELFEPAEPAWTESSSASTAKLGFSSQLGVATVASLLVAVVIGFLN